MPLVVCIITYVVDLSAPRNGSGRSYPEMGVYSCYLGIIHYSFLTTVAIQVLFIIHSRPQLLSRYYSLFIPGHSCYLNIIHYSFQATVAIQVLFIIRSRQQLLSRYYSLFILDNSCYLGIIHYSFQTTVDIQVLFIIHSRLQLLSRYYSLFILDNSCYLGVKYCVFSLKCCDFSELCQFCCSAGVCTHTVTKGKQRKTSVRNILKSLEKTQYLMNTLQLGQADSILRYKSLRFLSSYYRRHLMP